MFEMILSKLPLAGLILLAVVIFSMGYVKAPPNQAYIISGLRKVPRILTGKAAIRIPFLERLDKIPLFALTVDVKTSSPVPTSDYINVTVDSNVNIQIPKPGAAKWNIADTEVESDVILGRAIQNFLNKDEEEIVAMAKEVLEGNVREIIGQMKLAEIVTDRKRFAELVRENAAPDLAELGLLISNFNVQKVVDNDKVIENLGIDNVETIRKNAAIARAEAERAIKVAQAENDRLSNKARVDADQAMAEQNTALEIRKAALKKEQDTQAAVADAAHDIETERQRKTIELERAAANVAKEEKAIDIAQMQSRVREQELAATVKKEADADKYRREQEADAKLYEQQRSAEAELAVAQKRADAQRVVAESRRFAAVQEAAGIEAKGLAEAEAIRAQGLAKAAGLDAEAEAMRKMQEAAVINIVMEKMPEIAAAIAGPLKNVGNITMYGEGNVAGLIKDVTASVSQVNNGLLEGMGISLQNIVGSFVGGKALGAGLASHMPSSPQLESTPSQLETTPSVDVATDADSMDSHEEHPEQ